MAQIYTTSADQYNHLAQIGGLWTTIRGDVDSESSSYSKTATSQGFAVHAYQSARAGGTFFLFRTYLAFDLSGEGGTIDTATLSAYMDNLGTSTGNAAKIIAVEATALAGNNSDYGNIFTASTTLGTAMTNPFPVSTSGGYQDMTITGDASSGGIKEIQDHIGSGTITIALVSWYYDYENNTPAISGDYTRISIYFEEYSSGSRAAYLTINYAAAAENATFFGANF